jgi:hypothetical protein
MEQPVRNFSEQLWQIKFKTVLVATKGLTSGMSPTKFCTRKWIWLDAERWFSSAGVRGTAVGMNINHTSVNFKTRTIEPFSDELSESEPVPMEVSWETEPKPESDLAAVLNILWKTILVVVRSMSLDDSTAHTAWLVWHVPDQLKFKMSQCLLVFLFYSSAVHS